MPQSSSSFPESQLRENIQLCMIKDRHKLQKQLDKLHKLDKNNELSDADLIRLIESIEKSIRMVIERKDSKLDISFDEKLPISARKREIAELIQKNQVVILAGETGSGKTTQIPKICLELGRGVYGLIGHTQPRRIAARTVANRIADELNETLGETVGYQVRFNDQVGDLSKVKLMTDGILLADIQSDPYLNRYDTIIIDEAHERSLNIDFLLGYLKQLLPKRSDLKVIVTSATIDLEKFSEFFNNAPIVEVSGRTFPVEVRYSPWQDVFEDVNDAIVENVKELLAESKGIGGDILIFFSGEREIREASHALKKANISNVDVLPLYARLSLSEQNKIFTLGGRRKIVLSTNVAETSVTVPGIKYVIDPGTARISRYSLRTKVQRLPIEPISQASANQRKGRCGRVSDGICVRLYSEEDFNSRPMFTDAEILRTNLAAVILQMLQLRIGDVRKFDFIDAPDTRLISDGFKLLEELSAVDTKGKTTKLGRQLQQVPLDPKLARILVESPNWQCVAEILVIVSALSIQDPRERPADKQQAADEKHRRFWDEKSDFIGVLNLWKYVEEQRQELSQNQFRKLCKREFLNYMRLTEWRELHHQIKLAIKSLNIAENKTPSSYEPIHRALISGLVSQVGRKNDEKGARDYFGTRNKKFMIFPGSSQNKKKPKWCIAAEFIETSQLYAHQVANVESDWILSAANHLVKKNYFEPHYDVKTGQVKAYVRISLFGLVLVEKQRVNYNKIDQNLANEIFIREALVEGGYRGKGKFYLHNQKIIEEVHDLEAKSRRRDIMVDDQIIFDFYRNIVPQHIVNLSGFDYWLKEVERSSPDLLYLSKEILMLHGADHISEAQFPDQVSYGDILLPAKYCFEPGKDADGVSIQVPIELLHLVGEYYLDWLVPGLLRDKCIALVKGLPKQIRKHLVPVPQYVDKVLPRLKLDNKPLISVLGQTLEQISQVLIKEDDWNLEVLDSFYLMNIQIVDENGKIIEQSRDLSLLKGKYKQQVRQTLTRAGNDFEREKILSWDFEDIPEYIELPRGNLKVRGYPALVDKGDWVDLKISDNPREADRATQRGICRLALLESAETYKYLRKNLLKGNDIGLTLVNMGKRDQVADDLAMAAVKDACFSGFCEFRVKEKADFKRQLELGKADIVENALQFEKNLIDGLANVVQIKKSIKSSKNALAIAMCVADINTQIDRLFYKNAFFETPSKWFQQYPRFLKAIVIRLEKAPQNPHKDRLAIGELEQFWQLHEDRLKKEGREAYALNEDWILFRWMLEEYRVSLFAQTLKTLMPVSEKRLKKQWDKSL